MNLPYLKLKGDINQVCATDFTELEYEFNNQKGTCEVCHQGQSSLMWEKKNYTIKFDTPITVRESWGPQTLYCLKANFIDHTHSRNIVAARLWGEVVKTRPHVDEHLLLAPNYGAIDGFPFELIVNDEFYGLYTWNIPQAGWMLGMKDTEGVHQCFVGASSDTKGSCFRGIATFRRNIDYKIEYCATQDNSWVKPSLNNMLLTVSQSNGKNLEPDIADLVDLESAIDYMIYSCLITNEDGLTKNFQLATYDGIKWIFSAYDLDASFGLWWNGKNYVAPDNCINFSSWNTKNYLMRLLLEYKSAIIAQRYYELKNTVLSEDNIVSSFNNFINSIPEEVKKKDLEKWTNIPSLDKNNLDQIVKHYRTKVEILDQQIKSF